MSQSAIDKPLKTFFEPKTLNQLGIMGHILTPAVRYDATKLPKQGLARLLSYLPLVSKKPIVMDIDVGCVLLGRAGDVIERVHYGNIRSTDGGVRHGGDGLTGASDYESKFINQEQIHLHLDKIDQSVHHIIIAIANYHKQPLNLANKGMGVLRDNEGVLVHEFEMASLDKDTHAVVAWHIQRDDNDWLIHAPLKALKYGDMDSVLEQAAQYPAGQSSRW